MRRSIGPGERGSCYLVSDYASSTNTLVRVNCSTTVGCLTRGIWSHRHTAARYKAPRISIGNRHSDRHLQISAHKFHNLWFLHSLVQMMQLLKLNGFTEIIDYCYFVSNKNAISCDLLFRCCQVIRRLINS